MTQIVVNPMVVFPMQANLLFAQRYNTYEPFMATPIITNTSQNVAANTTITPLAALPNNARRFLRVFVSADAGGPWLFIFNQGPFVRIRQTPPFFIVLEFGPTGIIGAINTTTTIKNEHATNAGNIDVVWFEQDDTA